MCSIMDLKSIVIPFIHREIRKNFQKMGKKIHIKDLIKALSKVNLLTMLGKMHGSSTSKKCATLPFNFFTY